MGQCLSVIGLVAIASCCRLNVSFSSGSNRMHRRRLAAPTLLSIVVAMREPQRPRCPTIIFRFASAFVGCARALLSTRQIPRGFSTQRPGPANKGSSKTLRMAMETSEGHKSVATMDAAWRAPPLDDSGMHVFSGAPSRKSSSYHHSLFCWPRR